MTGSTPQPGSSASWYEHLKYCDLCPRQCRVNRLAGNTGFCHSGKDAQISSVGPHFGEEPPLVGLKGSGTIFFNRCNLGCIFCQNATISHQSGQTVQTEYLAEVFLSIQNSGYHNLNLVTPTPHLPAIVHALEIARSRDFNLPVIYNCGGYESSETIKMLRGVIDIYMPDIKSLDADWCSRFLAAPDYPDIALDSLKTMMDQVGNLQLNTSGVAVRGLLVRHLVMPFQENDTRAVLDAVYKICGPEAYVNVMDQYRPCFQAFRHHGLSRPINRSEWMNAVEHAEKLNLTRGLESKKPYVFNMK
ncbi:radical SAM protein [bacterium]|nr:radical SAM protein [candidate division CSSED10-310 bacterium]